MCYKIYVNHSDAEPRKSREKWIMAMPADAKAPCSARSSATIVWDKWDSRVPVFYEDAFQLHELFRWKKGVENTEMFRLS